MLFYNETAADFTRLSLSLSLSLSFSHHAGRGLTGTKLGCGEGGCGACTVVVSSVSYDAREDSYSYSHKAVNACLTPIYALEGHHVITVEGLGNARDGMHPVQMAIASAHGSQCGFCTPGFVMSMYATAIKLEK